MRHSKTKLLLLVSIPALVLVFLFLCTKTFIFKDSWNPRDKDSWKQKDLLITYCCSPPPEEKHVKTVAGECYNLMPTSEEALPFASKYNIKILLQHGLFSTETLKSPEKLEQLDALIKRMKDHPALEGYYIFDEPQESDFPALAKLVSRIKAQDPKHFCFINLLPIFGVKAKSVMDPSRLYKNYINAYIKEFKPDLLSYDYYAFLKVEKSPVNSLYFIQLRLVRECAQKAKLPFMNIIQASKFMGDWNLPTPDELRWQVYTTLAYGGRGINYFLYWGPKSQGGMYQDGMKTPLADAAAALNREMKAMSSTLMSMESLYVFHTAPFPPSTFGAPAECPVQVTSSGEYVVGVFGKDSKEQAFMIVNRNYSKAATAHVKVLGAEAISEFQRAGSTWKTISPDQGGEFVIQLNPGDGRLFRF